MSVQRVLVAFSSRSGSTGGIGQVVASVLREAGLEVDCRPASDVSDVTLYSAVVLGSGVFLPRRRSDGGGFLARHEGALGSRAVWLFCAGPIGRGHGGAGAESVLSEDCNVVEVARAIGARGWAVFGTPIPAPGDERLEDPTPVDLYRIRSWAREIAVELGPATAEAAEA
jgi:menaquinone-dependent protoporphyrinogen oxidase